MTRSYEAYEDQGGTLYIFALDDYIPVWSATYYGRDDEAGADWCGIVVQGCNPVADGWEGVDLAEAERLYTYPLRMIADSEATDRRPLGVYLDQCMSAGKDMAVAAGAAYQCARCGEIHPIVSRTSLPGGWDEPDRCESCGAPLD